MEKLRNSKSIRVIPKDTRHAHLTVPHRKELFPTDTASRHGDHNIQHVQDNKCFCSILAVQCNIEINVVVLFQYIFCHGASCPLVAVHHFRFRYKADTGMLVDREKFQLCGRL